MGCYSSKVLSRDPCTIPVKVPVTRVSLLASDKYLPRRSCTQGLGSWKGEDEPLDAKGQANVEATNGRASFIAKTICAVAPANTTMPTPKFLTEPDVVTEEEKEERTATVSKMLQEQINIVPRVLVVLGEDVAQHAGWQQILESSSDEPGVTGAPVTLAMGEDWLHTIPRLESSKVPACDGQFVIYIGTPGKHLSLCIDEQLTKSFDETYLQGRLAILCQGCVLLSWIDTHNKIVYGVSTTELSKVVADAVKNKGPIAWGHNMGTKSDLLKKAFPAPSLPPATAVAPERELPSTLDALTGSGELICFDYLAQYVEYLNALKLARPELPVTNWYDTGLLVSVTMREIASRGTSLLTDHDGLMMLRDASIGHTMSKLIQVTAVEPLKSRRGVYSFFIGDGACRMNGGMELACHLNEGYDFASMITIFVYNNGVWAIEDNLVDAIEVEHQLCNFAFYNLLGEHANFTICDSNVELKMTLERLTEKINVYVRGEEGAELNVIVIRGVNVTLEPILGDISVIAGSSKLAFMKDVMGFFAQGCQHKVPIYGCSAFEYIQFLHYFLNRTSEGKMYQYICGRTDIQAAHLCGFRQVERKCCLFINDIFGLNSLGESLRSVLASFSVNQVIIFIWHPTCGNVMDLFALHRPPMVWPSMGPHFAQFYARSQSEMRLFEFTGELMPSVMLAIQEKIPTIVINMMSITVTRPRSKCQRSSTSSSSSSSSSRLS
eukprot:NODE_818_length_2748_cov_10.223960.p1 GENE.NODE_818_length_2748_cov_10.223960~~NODE_818_length_2748_cov_10.223960.p1  ORF type:complete len:721 (-),score=147.20 NODE_818_length_2748_cov_10.223960:453-2615(-)